MLTEDGQPDGALCSVPIAGHGILMIFFVATLALFGGLGDRLMPLMIGAGQSVPVGEQSRLPAVGRRRLALLGREELRGALVRAAAAPRAAPRE